MLSLREVSGLGFLAQRVAGWGWGVSEFPVPTLSGQSPWNELTQTHARCYGGFSYTKDSFFLRPPSLPVFPSKLSLWLPAFTKLDWTLPKLVSKEPRHQGEYWMSEVFQTVKEKPEAA